MINIEYRTKYFMYALMGTTCFVLGCIGAPFSFGTGGNGGGGFFDAGPDTISAGGSSITSSVSSSTVASSTAASSGCMPATCAQLQANCGMIKAGCGVIIDCGSCMSPEGCGANKPNVCGLSNCELALQNPALVPSLVGTDLTMYEALFNCVCHNGTTTQICGFDATSIQMCGMNIITENFLNNDLPIGPCCAAQCSTELMGCRHDS